MVVLYDSVKSNAKHIVARSIGSHERGGSLEAVLLGQNLSVHTLPNQAYMGTHGLYNLRAHSSSDCMSP